MAVRAIHQLVAGYSNGDAISNEARTLRTLFRSWGLDSDIYCETIRILPGLRKDAKDVSFLLKESGPEDMVLLHLSIGSSVNQVFSQTLGIKVLLYHNVTPPDYFRALNEEIATLLERGRADMRSLAGVADLNLADSHYNAKELEEVGYHEVKVLPLVLELNRLDGPANRKILDTYGDGRFNVLFVGRCAPNKRIEDLLHTQYYLQKYTDQATRLIHVGSAAGLEQYLAVLRTLKRDLDLKHVDFAGSVPEEDLRAYYQSADVFLCMSEHEGFCIPLLEAMRAEVPVMAFDAAAVSETLDGAGVLFREKYFDEVAEWLVRLGRPGLLRDSVLAGQRRRIQRYEDTDVAGRLRDLLSPWL